MAKSETEAVSVSVNGAYTGAHPPLQGRRRRTGIRRGAIYKEPRIYDACYRAQDAKNAAQQAKTMTKGVHQGGKTQGKLHGRGRQGKNQQWRGRQIKSRTQQIKYVRKKQTKHTFWGPQMETDIVMVQC